MSNVLGEINLDEGDKYEDIFCSEHHPAHRSWFKKHRKTVQEHKNTRVMQWMHYVIKLQCRKEPGWWQRKLSTADQLQKQMKSTAEPIGKTKNKRESVVENVKVIGDIHKEVEATPTSRVSSTTKVTIRVDGNLVSSGRQIIVASINDGVDYVQPNFETDVEREGTAHHEIDFASQDNDHGKESEEEKEKTRTACTTKADKICI